MLPIWACWLRFGELRRGGRLASGELAAYAEQYRHIEAALPEVLRRVASNLPDGPARAAVHANLSDELGRPAPHLDLFDAFAAAAGARRGAPPAPATRSLAALQLSSAAGDPVRGLGVAFWDVHADLEADHADWTASALAATAASPAQVTSAAADGARAWWQFLDERQTAA